MRIAAVAFLLFAGLCAQAQVQEKEPVWSLKFTDFAAPGNFHGKPALPILATKAQRVFRSAIREAAAKGPNCAGHYTIAEWGCGSGCVSSVVVDAVTGKVFPTPFRILSMPLAESEGGHEYQGAVYQLHSRLFIADGCPEEAGCGTYYYEWSDNKFKRLRFDPAPAKNDESDLRWRTFNPPFMPVCLPLEHDGRESNGWHLIKKHMALRAALQANLYDAFEKNPGKYQRRALADG